MLVQSRWGFNLILNVIPKEGMSQRQPTAPIKAKTQGKSYFGFALPNIPTTLIPSLCMAARVADKRLFTGTDGHFEVYF